MCFVICQDVSDEPSDEGALCECTARLHLLAPGVKASEVLFCMTNVFAGYFIGSLTPLWRGHNAEHCHFGVYD